MRGALNLQDIMNDVASSLGKGDIPTRSFKQTSNKPLNELQAFTTLDPLLADLGKQYADAKANRIQAEKEYGTDDAMTEMAQWVEDSAWCAMQTRYMEVRTDRAMMKRAQTIMQESLQEFHDEERGRKDREALNFLAQLQMFERMHTKQDRNYAYIWLVYMIVLGDEKNIILFNQPSYNFNRLAA